MKALIERCTRDLPLFAPYVLRILRSVLQSRDVTMVEESIPTFISYCTHQDPANLAADQANITLFEEIIRSYAGFAQQGKVGNPKVPTPWPVAIRFRKAGLEAVKSIASSESMGSETGRQLAVIVPAILHNLFSEDGTYLQTLQSRDESKEEQEKEMAIRRRQSISTVRTYETNEADPVAASGTTEDADKLAEEEVGIMALQALRHVFKSASRVQLRLATMEVLKFVIQRADYNINPKEIKSFTAPTWSSALFAMISGWSPVQDRYAIVVTIVETLIRSPILEKELGRQSVLVEIIRSLLSSHINFIGLSIIDVLVGFIQHILLLLQLGGEGTAVHPHHQQSDVVDSSNSVKPKTSPTPQSNGKTAVETIAEASKERVELVNLLQKSIGSLATHIYYTDQISDMILTILTRLKPPPSTALPTAAAAVENPNKAATAVVRSANIKENEETDPYFSFETARLIAIAAIKDILMIANSKKSDGTSSSVGRAKVEVSVWDGTEWLMRDPSAKVRRAYVDVIITWLSLETSKGDLRVNDFEMSSKTTKKDRTGKDSSLVKRAVSNASHREKSPRRHKSTFLQLLHLAIYENALQYQDHDVEFVLMHLMLVNLIRYLGVNSARSGLPMMMRLQEDIGELESPGHKVRVGSLVLGYLWALTTHLNFEATNVGRAIHEEISRRAKHGVWLKIMLVPPMSLSQIEMLAWESTQQFTEESLGPDALRPFDQRSRLIDAMSDGYGLSLVSSHASPPTSPNRSFSIPILTANPTAPKESLPLDVKEELMSEWTKENCIASTAVSMSRTASVTGSRTSTVPGGNNLLGVSVPNWRLSNLSNIEIISLQGGQFGYAHGLQSPKHGSISTSALSSSSAKSAVRVEELKRVLSGVSRPPLSMVVSKTSAYNDDDTGSESMVSADFSASEVSFVTAKDKRFQSPERSTTPRGLNIPMINEPQSGDDEPDGIPPVPSIPPSFRSSVSPSMASSERSFGAASPAYLDDRPSWAAPDTIYEGDEGAEADAEEEPPRKSRSLRRGHSRQRSGNLDFGGDSLAESRSSRPDFSGFLDEIEAGDEARDESPQWRPPY